MSHSSASLAGQEGFETHTTTDVFLPRYRPDEVCLTIMLDLKVLLSQYPILRSLASWISAVDLYHLALTSRTFHALILESARRFDKLKWTCLCDGRGLADRKSFSGLYRLSAHQYVWGNERKIWLDEPIEVRLYHSKCDEAGALPCCKCGINVCEECRYYPREQPRKGYPERRPHLNSPFQLENIMCLCPSCDSKVEQELQGQFLNDLCDCDVYKRWICGKCVVQDRRFTANYFKERTTINDYESATKMMGDHQCERSLWCLCGATVPDDTRPRCTWCRRRHLPEEEWYREFEEVGSKMPFFEEDPCYPPYIGDIYAFCSEKPYPKLAYDGPIWQASESQ